MTFQIAQIYAKWAHQKRWFLFFVFSLAVLGAALGVFATIHQPILDTDIAHLLPQDSKNVRAFHQVEQRYGSSDRLVIAISGSDSSTLLKIQDSLAHQIQVQWSDIALSVQTNRDPSFFTNHALFYLDNQELDTLARYLQSIRTCLSKGYNPLAAELLNNNSCSTPLPLSPTTGQRLGLAHDVSDLYAQILAPILKSSSNHSPSPLLSNRLLGRPDAHSPWTAFVQIRMVKPATNPLFTSLVLERSQALLHAWHKQKPQVQMEITGAFADSSKHFAKARKWISVVGSGLLLLWLILLFLRPHHLGANAWIVVVASKAALSSSIVSLALLLLIWTHLDAFVLFAWLLSTALAMGLAFALTLSIQNSQDPNPIQRVAQGLSHWLWPWLGFLIATIFSGLTLFTSPFYGYRELALTLVESLAIMSLFVLLYVPWYALWSQRIPAYFIANNSLLSPKSRTWAFAIGVLGLIITAIATLPQMQIRPEAFAQWRVQNAENALVQTGLFSSTQSPNQQTTIVLASDPQELWHLHQSLQQDFAKNRDSLLMGYMTLASIYPSAVQQEERSYLIEEIHQILISPEFDHLQGPQKEVLTKLRSISGSRPFSLREIPPWSLELLSEKDGRIGNVALIYGNYPTGDLRKTHLFEQKFAHLNFGGQDLVVYSPNFLWSDLFAILKTEHKRAIWATALFLIILLLWNWHSWRQVLQPLLVGGLWLCASIATWLIGYGAFDWQALALLWVFSFFSLGLMFWSTFPASRPRKIS